MPGVPTTTPAAAAVAAAAVHDTVRCRAGAGLNWPPEARILPAQGFGHAPGRRSQGRPAETAQQPCRKPFLLRRRTIQPITHAK